jgi:CheY-like chemotaxis protein/HPt (histidine-containing phosphotransfer) domain-containing protein
MLQRPAEVEQETVGHAWHAATEELKGVRILLAEDGFDNRELIQAILRKVGALVETAENGRLAVAKVELAFYDLILMDMNMPEMDGYEATSLLRDRGYTGPILALTANAMSGDADRCLAVGCDEYLTKPIDRRRLIQRIAAHVDIDATAERLPASASRDAPVPGSDVLVSQFSCDPDMAPIIQRFVGRLADQLAAMRDALKAARFEELRRLAHTLKGAGGSYGYPSLTETCKTLEDAAKNQDSAAAFAALAAVGELVYAIRSGCDTNVATGRSP